LEEQSIIQASCVVIHFTEFERIDYIMQQYIFTGLLPFNAFCKEWFTPREKYSLHTTLVKSGEPDLMRSLMKDGQEVESQKKRRKDTVS